MSKTASSEKPEGRFVRKARKEKATTRVRFMLDSVEGGELVFS